MSIPVDVPSGAHESAIDYLYEANQSGNQTALDLSSALEAYAGMAGDDSIGREWGTEYDKAAAALVQGGADLTNAMGAMANLLNANLVNHDNADYSARIATSPYTNDPGADGDADPDHSNTAVYLPDPSSAIGGNGGEPTGWGLIASHLEGFLWPDADTGRLREAANTWRSYATSFGSLNGQVLSARGQIAQVQSPEIGLVLAACDDLEAHTTDLSNAMVDLATACDDYASQVDQHHQQIFDLLEDLVAWSAVDQVAGFALSFFSFGAAEGGAQAVEAGLITRCAFRVLSVLKSLKTLGAAIATRIVTLTSKVIAITSKLAKFLKAERLAARLNKAAVLIGLKGKKLAGVIKVPAVKDAKLKNYVDQFYKGASSPTRTGSGTTADAVRAEKAGAPGVHGRNHIQKAEDLVRGLQKWLRRNPGADPDDISAAQTMLDDLLAALAGR